jgi:hypothetical protein
MQLDHVINDFFEDFGDAATSGVPLREVTHGLVQDQLQQEITVEVL